MPNTPTLMLKSGVLVLALLLAPMLYAADTGPRFPRKANNEAPAMPLVMMIPVVLPEAATTVSRYRDTTKFSTILPILEDCRVLNFDELPDEYDNWDESLVNPYGVRLVGMKDTVKIDMRGYYPPSKKYVTSNFGFRRGGFHYGIDLKVHKGDSIYCAFDGQVRLTKSQRRGYGQYVVVRHNNGLETLYAHLSKTLVSPGQTVKAGEVLGLGGSTGRSTGYHLHFETRYLGNVIDPNDLYDFNNCCVKDDVFWLSATNFEYVKEIEKIRYWTVRSGDTLGKIAARTGVSITRLCNLNKIKKTSILRIGQKIRYS